MWGMSGLGYLIYGCDNVSLLHIFLRAAFVGSQVPEQGMARSNVGPPWCLAPLGPPAAVERDDNLADRSPPGMARSDLGPPRCLTPLAPASSVRTWRQFRRSQPPPPGIARSNLGPPRCLTPLAPPAAFECGDRFADRSPPGMARSSFGPPRCFHSAGPTSSLRKRRPSYRSPPPPPLRGLVWVRRGASLRWTHQQPSNVATVSQIAAPQGWRGLI